MPSSSVPPCSSCVMLARQERSAQDAVIDRDNIVTPALLMPLEFRSSCYAQWSAFRSWLPLYQRVRATAK